MADFEFRPAKAEEMTEFSKLGTYVFAADEPPDPNPLQPEWTLAAFHDGKLVASSGGFPFKMRWNGRSIDVDGVTMVGTSPGYRRRGLVRRLITDLLHRAHDNNQIVSILWASMGAIYQRFGYGLASSMTAYKFDPRLASFQFGDRAAGETHLVDREEAKPIMAKLYREFIEDRNLLLHRMDVMWELAFQGLGAKTHCAIHYDPSGKPDGYMTYRTKFDETLSPPSQKLNIDDLVYRDINAYRGLWEYVLAHDLVTQVEWIDAPQDDPAPTLLLEPRILGARSWDGIWLRVVDAKATLAQRGYDLTGEVTLEIKDDPECPWNVRRYHLEASPDGAHAQPTDAKADVELTPHALASLLSGHQTLSHLIRIGRASTADPSKLAELDALFATRYRPSAMNDF